MSEHEETTQTKTIRLLDVVPGYEVVAHPVRSLLALANRALSSDVRNQVLDACGEQVYCRLETMLAAPEHGLDESACKERMGELAAILDKPDAFFDAFNEGQTQLALLIADLVAGGLGNVRPSLTYAPGGLSFDAPDPTVENPDLCEACGTAGDRNKTDWCMACGKGWDSPKTPSTPTCGASPEEIAELDGKIAELERPGWPKTSEQQARLEQLRGRRAEQLAPQPQSSRAQHPRVRPIALHRAVGYAEEIAEKTLALQLMLAQAGVELGLVKDLLALADQVVLQVKEAADNSTKTSADGASLRNVRYLSDDEHQFLARAARDPHGIVTYHPMPSSIPERMDSAGLLCLMPNEGGKRRAKITWPGRVALRTWRYEVPSG